MVVRMRHTRRATRMRRSGQKQRAGVVSLSKCSHCGEAALPHRVCPHCGYLRGRQVIDVVAATAKKAAAKKKAQTRA